MRLPVSLVSASELRAGDSILVCANENGNTLPEFVGVVATPLGFAHDGKVGIELATGEKWVVRSDAPMVASCKEEIGGR